MSFRPYVPTDRRLAASSTSMDEDICAVLAYDSCDVRTTISGSASSSAKFHGSQPVLQTPKRNTKRDWEETSKGGGVPLTGKKRTKPDPAGTPPCPKQKAALTHSKCAVQMLPRSIRSIKTTFIGQTLVPAWPQYTVGEDLTHTYMKLYDREEWYTAVLCGVKNILTKEEKRKAKSLKQVGDDVSVAITSDIKEQIRKAHSQHLTKSQASQPDVVDVAFKGIVIQVKVMAAGMRSLLLRSNEAFLHWINHHLAPAMKECMIGGSQPRAVVGDRVLPKGDGDSRVGVREKVKWAVQQHAWMLMVKKSKVVCWRAYTRDNGIDLTVKPIDCLLYTSPSPRDGLLSRMPSSA